MPLVEVVAVLVKFRTANKPMCEDAIIEALSVAAANAQRIDGFIHVTCKQRQACPVCIRRILGDDVNHAINGVRPPNGSSRTANHFNAIDVSKRKILNIPKNTGKEWGIYAASVDQHQH